MAFKVVKKGCNVVVILGDGAGGADPPCWRAFGRRRRSGAGNLERFENIKAGWPAGHPAGQPAGRRHEATEPTINGANY